ncbi:hypothetical protein Dimus_037217 [Dionaea muscipula]
MSRHMVIGRQWSQAFEYLSLTRKMKNQREEKTEEEMMISMFQAEEEVEKEEENRTGFDWEARIDEAATEGESGRERSFMMPRMRICALRKNKKRFQRRTPLRSHQAAGIVVLQSRPSGPTAEKPNFRNSSAEFERKRANKFHDDPEKAKAENADFYPYSTKLKPNPILSFSYLPFPP